MRILLVSHRYSPDIGGIEEIVSRQAKALSQKGNEVRVVTTTNDEAMIGERIENGVKVNRFPGYAPNNAYYFSRKMGVYLKNITKNYDLIHAHNYHAFPAFYAFRNKNSTPFILSAHYHGGSRNKFRNLLLGPYKLLSKRMVEQADSIVCVSHSEKELLERDFSLPPTYVNHNAVEFESSCDVPKQGDLCVLGRLENYKNVDMVIRAFWEAGRRGGRKLKLNIIGDGPDRKRLENLVRKKGLTENVIFHGFVSEEEKRIIISSCSCMITMSSHESFGITIIEAANHGLRVIASNIAPHRELARILGGGVTLANPKNTEKIAEHIIEKSNMKEVQVFDNLSKFSWEKNINRLLGIYKGVLNNH